FRAVVAERLGLAAITETMAEGVVVTRASDLEIVYTNPTFDSMLGYEERELLREPITRIKPPGQEQLDADISASVARVGRWRGEVQNLRKDGSLVWCLSTVTTLEH